MIPARPWRVSDVELLCVVLAVGLGLVVVGWYGASDELTLDDQIVWVNVAVAGLIVFSAGGLLWLLNISRAVSELRRQVMDAIDVDEAEDATAPAAVDEPLLPAGSVVVTGATMLHRRDCPLVAGKAARASTAKQRRTLRPCGICQP